MVPFRWDVRRREQLGRLLDAPIPNDRDKEYYGWRWPLPGLLNPLRECCARVLTGAGDARLVFVGRSPESLFDYLTGALADTPWADRCDLLSVSLPPEVNAALPHALRALREQHRAFGLHPAAIASAPRPIAFVDLVWKGRTFGQLSAFLSRWARDEGVDVNAVRRRLRWVGIAVRGKNSPNAWRWFQQLEWAAEYSRRALRGVSVTYGLWTYLGDDQVKTMPSNTVDRWGTDDLAHPIHDTERLDALQEAFRIHHAARQPEERERFAAELVGRPEMREAWLRSLVVALRR
ncbi:MAG TPA: hypothetical protein VFT45_06035 [Longimicrobium sp.]|nr:hypothetical protein [Longimicrobium sp.]